MELQFLGTGDCAGVPVYNCNCPVCKKSRKQPALQRRSSGAYLRTPEANILIDAGLANLSERFPRETIDLILLSHYHIDHVYGLFPMRWGYSDKPLPVYGPNDPNGCADLLKHPGIFDFSITMKPFVTHTTGTLEFTPLPLNHSKPSLGYAISTGSSRLAWLSDTSNLPPKTIKFLQQWHPGIIILDCTFPPRDTAHLNHNDVNLAVALHQQINPQKTYLTHISHELDNWLQMNKHKLPEAIDIAADGMTLSI